MSDPNADPKQMDADVEELLRTLANEAAANETSSLTTALSPGAPLCDTTAGGAAGSATVSGISAAVTGGRLESILKLEEY